MAPALSESEVGTRTDDEQRSAAPAPSLPKGGGAIRGIGEKFSANPVTGTGMLTVPVPVSPGRSGFGPELALAYDSGGGNGIFGYGWSLSLPTITRRTDKGLPRYSDAGESDVFVLSGAEDLVPVHDTHIPDRTLDGVTYRIQRYRPRIEGSFALIERWTDVATGDAHWRSISRDNVTTLYGKDDNSRLVEPASPDSGRPRRIFSWLICERYDDKGNAEVYTYKQESAVDVPLSQTNERNRSRSGNRHLKSIRYGNRVSRLVEPDLAKHEGKWMFEIVLDYGEHDEADPTPADGGDWICRHDPFSSNRAGFELRTYRLCQRILIFHHFPDEEDVGADCLVRSLSFTYASTRGVAADVTHGNPVASCLASITVTGHRRKAALATGYTSTSLPALEFEYSRQSVDGTLREVDATSSENMPQGVDGSSWCWIDLDGEGIAGVLSEQPDGWYYKANLGEGRFGPLATVRGRPSTAALEGRHELLDLAGDGQLDVVGLEGPTAGFFERTDDGDWTQLRTFGSLPNVDWLDPNLRFVDLSGDGQADVAITTGNGVTWHPSLGEDGFGPAELVPAPTDEEVGPRLLLADGTRSTYLADMSGDGLNDLVRIANGSVCYWPNLGYGRFGAKVEMDDAPVFAGPNEFDQARIRLADVDGSGCTDIVYLGEDAAVVYANESGNRWSAPRRIAAFPSVDNLASVVATDLLGTGTTCLVWSSPLPTDAGRALRFVDLVGDKPHLLTVVRNNLGAETRITYTPSTRFYLADKAAGRPWTTRLPFPVHVVERVVTLDHVSGNRFVTSRAYHDGYFDGEEREFRGFGLVEQWDTEELAALLEEDAQLPATNLDPAWHVPPVLTRTRFHTGSPALATDGVPPGLTPEEEREACRALKGAMLREEIYAQDGSAKEDEPYRVTDQTFTVECLQRRGPNRHAVFLTHTRETITYHHEREPTAPRIGHSLTLHVDRYGNVRKSLSIGYGRAQSPLPQQRDRDKQTTTLITYTESDFTNAVDDPVRYPDDYRAPHSAETRTYELTGYVPEHGAARFSLDEWTRDDFALLTPTVAAQKRLIAHVRTQFRSDDLTRLLPLRELEPLALPGDTFRLALTPSLVADVFADLLPDPAAILEGSGADLGGYVEMDGSWWIPTGTVFYAVSPASASAELAEARSHFFLPRVHRDQFGKDTTISYGPADPALPQYDLLVSRTTDAVGNAIEAVNDYRVLRPRLVLDPNRNRTAAAYDALGLLVATAEMGKEGESVGDLLEDVEPDSPLAAMQAFVSDPEGEAASLLGKATTRIVYDLGRYARAGQPPFAATLARETHVHDLAGGQTRIQVSFLYSDGFGREIQKKTQAETGDAPKRQAPSAGVDVRPGELVRDAAGKPILASAPHRWVGSGRTVFNNKGKPVKQYEPFFSSTHLYEPERQLTDGGVSPVLFYDPLERIVVKLHPNDTYEKVVFDPWQQTTFDVNDTVASRGLQTGDPRTDPDVAGYVAAYFEAQPAGWTTWYERRIHSGLGAAELDAAQKAAVHADTPAVVHLDALGRPFMTVAHNRFARGGAVTEERYATRVDLDVQGDQRAVWDERTNAAGDLEQRVVMRYDYDLARTRIHRASMEAGERWTLADVAGKPLRAWDSRGFTRRTSYDDLRRPTGLYVTDYAGATRLVLRTVYGELQGDVANHRNRVHQVFDDAGVVTYVAYDFKGNVRESRRDLLPASERTPDWQQNLTAGDGSFTTQTTYDALNRPLTATSPDDSVHTPTFNAANLLDKVDVKLRGASAATSFITNVDYNAKGQRTVMARANGVQTTYEYDPQTFRLARLTTTRPTDPDAVASQLLQDAGVVQDLRYTYDPAGNIVRVEDAALATVFYDNQKVEPVAGYTYDALYRIIESQGREHVAQSAFALSPANGGYRDYPFLGQQVSPNDLQALRNYTERYDHDGAGNFTTVRHLAANGNWTRTYDYDASSLVDTAVDGNRLTGTGLRNGVNSTEVYGYDAHGNMTSMPHLASMTWDYADRLVEAEVAGGAVTFVHDSTGQRARKVVWSAAGARRYERLYLGGFELYRRFAADGTTVTDARESLHVMAENDRVALVETQTIENGTAVALPTPVQRHQLANHLGSACVELDADGALITWEEYSAYGATSFQAGRSAAEASLKRYRYTGQERDEETGLSEHGARFYAPWLGRWTSCDPAGLDGGMNLYAYVAANPLSKVDRSGTAPADAAKAADSEKKFRETHVYSTSPDAPAKLKIDEQILGGDFSKAALIDMHNEDYLKSLISAASKGTVTVKTDAEGLQFFIIKGGGEGFLPKRYEGVDASDVVTTDAETTDGVAGAATHFDNNDLIAVFDPKGKLISSALLERPFRIPDYIRQSTADKVYNAWDNRPVSLYRNENFARLGGVKYFGLKVDDSLGAYRAKQVRIDMHKQEATDGCIFIVDDKTPTDNANGKLDAFEPQFIRDVMSAAGVKKNIGTMRMVTIK
jgi:RHS repeat-associated protein